MRSPTQDFGIGQYTERGITSFIFSYDIASRLLQADQDIGEHEPCNCLTSETGRVRRFYRSNCRRISAHDTTSAGGTGHCGVSPQQLFLGVYASLCLYDVSGCFHNSDLCTAGKRSTKLSLPSQNRSFSQIRSSGELGREDGG